MSTAIHPTLIYKAPEPTSPAPTRWLGGLLIAEALLSFAPLIVLGAAIGWPASLGNSAARQLQAIAAKPAEVAFGYSLYLLYSILIAPLMIGVAHQALGGLNRPLAATVAAFATLSALARSIGILRWLTVMPMLASAYAGADAAGKAQIELTFSALHSYGGGVGEILGVSLFMAAALGLAMFGALRLNSMPRWIVGIGMIAAAALFGLSLPALGVGVRVPVAAAVSLLSLWMLCAGGWCLLRKADSKTMQHQYLVGG
jgi:Domain of unknown function (DUF4386)